MRRLPGILIAATLLTAACQSVPIGTASKKPTVAKSGAKASAAPSATPSAAPTSPTLVASKAPAVPMLPIAGSLRMDASFVVAAGGGNVVAAGGGNVVAAGGGNVIAAGGGNLIVVGGQVVAAGGGNVIAPGGANVVAAGGGNAVASGGANYHVAAESANGPTYGQLLPAKGMVVVPVSLKTGKVIGEAVFTDEKGGFTVQVPKSETGNVRLVAAVPSEKEEDARKLDAGLALELMVSTASADSTATTVIDDDTSLLSRYARTSFAGRVYDLIRTKDQDSWGEEVEAWASTGDNAFVKGLLDELYQEMKNAGCADLPQAEQHALAQQLADIEMAYVDLDQATVDKSKWPEGNGEKAYEALGGIIKKVRVGAIAKMTADHAYFTKAPYLQGHPDRVSPATIKRPADFFEFIVANYLSINDSGRLNELRTVFEDIGVEPDEVNHIKAAEFGILSKSAMTMLLDADAKKAMFDAIRAVKK